MNILRKIFQRLAHRPSQIYCSIGDFTTKKLIESGIHPRKVIVDGHTRNNQPVEIERPRFYRVAEIEFRGRYNKSIDKTLGKLLGNSDFVWINVRGEEDHLIWGAITSMPLNSKLVSAEGEVTITEELQRHAKHQKVYTKCYVGTDLFRRMGARYRRRV